VLNKAENKKLLNSHNRFVCFDTNFFNLISKEKVCWK